MNKTLRILAAFIVAVSTIAVADTTTAAQAGAQAGPAFYDTMWELPLRSSVAEADAYFAYIAGRGYDGAVMSLFSGSASAAFERNAFGNLPASLDANGKFVVNQAYLANTRALLDRATAYGMSVILLPLWANTYLHGLTNGACDPSKPGVLNAGNARDLGQQIAAGLGDHPAIGAWMLGGDNWCAGGIPEDPNIWRNFDAGLTAGGATQQVGYHAPGSGGTWYDNEPWLDFHGVQTSHCTEDGDLAAIFAQLNAANVKPNWAAETRYEDMEPTFCPNPGDHGAGNPVLPSNVASDVREALASNLDAIVYGHNERWTWGSNGIVLRGAAKGYHGSAGLGWQSIVDSFFAPGEALALAIMGRKPVEVTAVTPPTPAPVAPQVVPRSFTVGYNASAFADLTWAAGYLKMSPAEVQQAGLFVARFLTYIGGRQHTPNPIPANARPATNGAVLVTSAWTDTEVEVVDWNKAYFGLNSEESHFLGASLMTFLAGIDANRKGLR